MGEPTPRLCGGYRSKEPRALIVSVCSMHLTSVSGKSGKPMMLQYVVKTLMTAAVVVAVSEIAKRSTFWGAAIASLPLTSLLAFVWLYRDTGNAQRVADLSQSILWLILPSLVLFVMLPTLLRSGVGFWLSLAVACAVTAAAYLGMVWCLGRSGVRI